MEYRQLGSSDLNVSVLTFGAWQIGDPEYWGQDEQADADNAVAAAIDVGVNFFDTAEQYGEGESERVLGKALGKRRGNVCVASKVSPHNCAPPSLRKACERSLQQLKTDYLDLYQIHWPFSGVSHEEVFAEMKRLQKEGKIRYIGVSNFGKQDLRHAVHNAPCVSDQLGYNLVFRAIEYEIVPACQKHGVGILAYMPLMQGLLTGRWQHPDEIPPVRRRTRHFSSKRELTRHGEEGCEELLFAALKDIAAVAKELGTTMATLSLAWVMAQPGVTSVIAGARRADQVTRNAAAADLQLSQDVIDRLNAITEPIKTHLGGNADLWDSGERARIR